MKAIILKKKILDEVYSASGIEKIDELLYIIGDDSPYLYILDMEGEVIEKKELFKTSSNSEGRISKKEKPDLEALTAFEFNGKKYLLTIGSGSKEEKRDKGFLIEIANFATKEISLTPLYSELRKNKVIVGEEKLNVEGLCTSKKDIILLLRGNISGKNITLRYDLPAFMSHLMNGSKIIGPKISAFNLPSIDGWSSGFSGAVYDEKNTTIFFTASVEATKNEIDDGTALASFIGKIQMNGVNEEKIQIFPITKNGTIYKGKVESITLLDEPNKVLAVTDSDGGDSELLWIEIKE